MTYYGEAGRGADQYIVRFPIGMRDDIKMQAKRNRRSMNAEIVTLLERALAGSGAVEGEGLDSNTPSAAN
ncbi:Arc family DNA-binding protein [Maritalea porphyrae]|uniref:Arc family DNA-binding protein n=1 Tax=Maritalea porphyrae TaxID=880732 RepID=UPI0022B0223B|nr:Arc family DNA-binding protein [Maritalea porphyrae]MCZ4270881.1 Arc family DNA-binding protein [Maritalea porphyrae]